MTTGSDKPAECIVVPVDMFGDAVEFLLELRGAWAWKKPHQGKPGQRSCRAKEYAELVKVIDLMVQYRDGTVKPAEYPASAGQACPECGGELLVRRVMCIPPLTHTQCPACDIHGYRPA